VLFTRNAKRELRRAEALSAAAPTIPSMLRVAMRGDSAFARLARGVIEFYEAASHRLASSRNARAMKLQLSKVASISSIQQRCIRQMQPVTHPSESRGVTP